jgi:hypothetical protein
MPEALHDGTVTEAAITRAAGCVLYESVHFCYLDGQFKHEVTEQAIETNAKIIQRTGAESRRPAQERRRVALPWIDRVKAVLEMWWPGDEGGWSTANILAGKTHLAAELGRSLLSANAQQC